MKFKKYIKNVPDFPKKGIVFRDISPLLKSKFKETINALSSILTKSEWQKVDYIAGIESRGFILAASLACQMGKGFVFMRKKGKLPKPDVALDYSLEYGKATLEMHKGKGKLIIVDDVIASGGTMRAAAELSRQAGYSVEHLITLIDLNLAPSFSWNKKKVRSLVKY